MSTFKDLVREVYEIIKNLRASPHQFAKIIHDSFAHYKADHVLHRPGTVPLQTREGLSAAEEVYEELSNLEHLQELELSAGLSTAATQHCLDTGPLGIVGHIGSRETSLQKRVETYGKWSGNLVEALDYGSGSALEVVLSLLIDDGLATRPHRKALLNPSFTKIGIGAGPHSEFKVVVCILFSVGYTELDSIDFLYPSENEIPVNPQVEDWLEGAVKLTSEIREETVNGEKVRKIKNHWEMRDGTIKVIDKTEKIVNIKDDKKKTHELPHHDAPAHHVEVHHEAPAHHVEVHHEAPAHHAEVHHEAPAHHVEVHHEAPAHHVEVHHEAPVHHVEVHHETVHHVEVHHETVHHEVPLKSETGAHSKDHEVHKDVHQDPHHEEAKTHHETPEHHSSNVYSEGIKPLGSYEPIQSSGFVTHIGTYEPYKAGSDPAHPVHHKKKDSSSDSDSGKHKKRSSSDEDKNSSSSDN